VATGWWPMADSTTTTSRRLLWSHRPWSVRVRITVAAALVTAVAVGAAGWLLVRVVEDAQIRQLRDDIDANLDQVATRLQKGDDPVDAVEAATASLGFVVVTDQRGRLVAASASAPLSARTDQTSDAPVPGDEPPAADKAEAKGALSLSTALGGDIATQLQTRTVDTPSGRLKVTSAAPVDQVARSIDALRRALVIGLPALVAGVAIIAFLLVGRALRPVEAIRAEVDAITGSTMHRRVPEPPIGDEIGRLARTMNAMLDRLDATATRQRQFVADASHELRSPVAVIRTGLEVARRKADRANWSAVADAALAEESRLEALLDDLLLLATHDESGAPARQAGPVNLSALVSAEAQRPRRVPVDVAHPDTNATTEPVVIPGADGDLTRMVSNLVDNAARHAATVVHIDLASQNDIVRLTVDDDGPGIAPGDRHRIFERFARLDDSRSRDRGGSGLGLAVVRSIVTRHRGHVWVEDSPTGGARFVVELPARSPTPPTHP
jgi:signal transduction histidine kinase